MFTHSRYPKTGKHNYEVSSKGDKRFSALYATLQDGRTIEEAYQLDVKGYRKFGNNWKLGKGKKPLDLSIDTWKEYKNLWKLYLDENPDLVSELQALNEVNFTDMFASTPVSQARALAELLNELSPIESIPMKQFNPKQYLAIDIANHYGLDKLNYEDRIQWVKAHYDRLELYTEQADEPILFAKAVHALRVAENGLPIGHTVAFDSASSGLQLMSLLTNCKSGMELTGLIDPDNRKDAYTLITNRINERLRNDPDIDMVTVERKDAKQAIMTHLYGSTAVPERVFGEALNVFYSVMNEMCHGASRLLTWLLDSWDENRDEYIWVMPDNHTVYIPVMVRNDVRIKVPALNSSVSATFYTKEATETGLSNAANMVHSVDAYVLRSLVRRCNYDKAKILKYKEMNATTHQDTHLSTHWVNERYNSTKIADISMIYTLVDEGTQTLSTINPALRDALSALCDELLTYEPFDVVCVHDSFACHPNHVQRLREQYNEVLVTLYESDILSDLLSQLYQDDASVNVGEKNLSDIIRNSNYGIC